MTKPTDEAGPESNPASSEPAYIGTERAWKQKHLPPNGGDGGGSALDIRVAVLEAHVTHMQSDVSEIKGLLSNLGVTLHHLPTKQDLFSNVATMVVIGLTVLVLAVGSIIGGLAWLQPKEAPEQRTPMPIVLQMPSPMVPSSVAPPSSTATPPPKTTAPSPR